MVGPPVGVFGSFFRVAVRGSVGELVGGEDGGAPKLEVPGSVAWQRVSISVSVNVKETRLRIVKRLIPGPVWSLLPTPGLQACPQALPPAIVASPSGPSASRKSC